MHSTTQVQVRERPILFRPELVRAILSGKKTVTRRRAHLKGVIPLAHGGTLVPHRFGEPGDRLWVREATWVHPAESRLLVYDATPNVGFDLSIGQPYEAAEANDPALLDYLRKAKWRRCPSIHMPRAASRLTLDVVSVRAERLQRITEGDVAAEGLERCETSSGCPCPFEEKWNQIHPNAPDRWEDNPWVWRIRFKVAEVR